MGGRNLTLAQLSFAAAFTSEWAFATGLAVVAFEDGGAGAVGVVGLLRMLPAVFITPLASSFADQGRRERVLAAISVSRAVAIGLAALVLVADGSTLIIYLLAVVATAAFTAFRPAHSALLPSLCHTPRELTRANVVRTAMDAGSILGGPLLAAALLALDGAESVFAAAAALALLSALLVVPLRYELPPAMDDVAAPRALRALADGWGAIMANPHMRVLSGMTMVQTFTRGALQVFTVVVAIELLRTGDSGVGVLGAAVGAGGLLSLLVVPRVAARGRLGWLFGIGVALWGLPLMLLAATSSNIVAIVLLGIVGLGNVLVDVGLFTLFARLAPDEVLARVFGLLEAVIALAVGLGSITVPLVIELFGERGALVVVGALAPLAFLLSLARLRWLDTEMGLQDMRISILRRAPILEPLPAPTIEFLARHAEPSEIAGGTTLFEQGDEARCFYVIAEGEADVIGDGKHIRTLRGGDYFGEIALMKKIPRTTTIQAKTDLRLYALDRQVFVPAVSGYSASADEADLAVAGRLATFAPRGATI